MIDGNGNAVLLDFGFSISMLNGHTAFSSSNFDRSLRFSSPDLLENEERTISTDIYALGCTCMQVRANPETILYAKSDYEICSF